MEAAVPRFGAAGGRHAALAVVALGAALASALVARYSLLGFLGFLGICVGGAVIWRPEVGLWLVVAGMVFPGGIPLVGPLTVMRTLSLVTLAAWALDAMRRGRRLAWGPHQVAVLGFCALAVASVGWAYQVDAAVEGLQTLGLVVGLYFIVVNFVDSQARLTRLLYVVIFSGILAAGEGVWQHFSEGMLRAAGWAEQANFFALSMAVAAPFAVALALCETNRPLRTLAGLAAALMSASVLFTVSRRGLVALAVAIGLLVLLFRHGRLVLFGLCALLVVVGVSSASPEFWGRLREPFEEGNIRFDIWRVGAAMVAQRPVTGIGFNNALYEFDRFTMLASGLERGFSQAWFPHNTYLSVTAELGVVGLVCFLSLLALSFHQATVARRRFDAANEPLLFGMSSAGIASLAGYLCAGFFGDQHLFRHLWLLLALTAVLGRLASQRGADFSCTNDGHEEPCHLDNSTLSRSQNGRH